MKKSFLYAILFLVIGITIGVSLNVSAQQQAGIPSWIKNTAKWWANGQVSDDEFIKALQYLINQGILVVPQSGSSQQSSNSQIQGFQTYTNQVYKFSIQYPQDWSAKEEVNGKVDIGSGSYQLGVIVAFVTPVQNNPKYTTNVNVKTIGGISGTSLDDLSSAFKNGIQELYAANDFKEMDEGKMQINNINAFYIEYLVNFNGVAIKAKQVFIPNGDNAYIITYGSEQSSYDTYLSQFEKSVSSFKFLS